MTGLLGRPARLRRVSELPALAVADRDADVRGWDVLRRDGQLIGRVTDLLVDPSRLVAEFAVVTLEGASPAPGAEAPMPLAALRPEPRHHRLVVGSGMRPIALHYRSTTDLAIGAVLAIVAIGAVVWLMMRPGPPSSAAPQILPEQITVEGCVERRADTGDVALRVVDPYGSPLRGGTIPAASLEARGGSTSGVVGAAGALPETKSSTVVNGTWLGSRVLALGGRLAGEISEHLGRRVRVNGVLEGYVLGDTGAVDVLQSAYGVTFRTLRAVEFEPIAGSCPTF